MAETKHSAETPLGQLTLQQKFVKLREAVPYLQQKQHSDGVKYKFAKLSDIYELLTPAMNEHGVNFDIVKEEATRHDELGNALFYHNYTQQTRSGPRTVWVYEAELTIRWTNADVPGDTLEVTLHAIGTNDGGPDKAKGSAWTYCLKYYFFEKFGVDQGEDDPDMKDSGGTQTPQPETSGQPTGARNSGGGTNTHQNRQNAQNERTSARAPHAPSRMHRSPGCIGSERKPAIQRNRWTAAAARSTAQRIPKQ